MSSAETIRQEFQHYAYAVSHDLGAPVRAMVEFSRILAQECGSTLDKEHREYLTLIVENGHHMQAMMEGLLRYSRLNTLARPFAAVASEKLVAAALAELAPVIEETQAIINVVPDLPIVAADEAQLQRALFELIDNALKFTLPGQSPHITVSAALRDDHWRFEISDNGIGVPEIYHEKIFQLFQRLHISGAYKGIGMGLTLVRNIVERHGGSVGVAPNAPQGSIFFFTLPKKDSACTA